MNARAYRWAALSGLCALIPLPFVDAWAQTRARRHAVGAALRARGMELDADTLHLLNGPYDGFLSGCLAGLLRWPVKKLFRTVLVVLLIEDVLFGVARAVVQVDLVLLAARDGHLPARPEHVARSLEVALCATGAPLWRRIRRLPRPEPVPPLAAEGSDSDRVLARLLAVLHRDAGGALARERFLPLLQDPT